MTHPDLETLRHNATAPARRRAAWWLAGLVVLCGPVAAAQTETPDIETATDAVAAPDEGPSGESSALSIDLTAGAWLARLNGTSRLGPGPGAGSIDLENDLDLDDSEPSFNAELAVRFLDGWKARVSGYQFSTDDSGTFAGAVRFGSLTLLPGDAYRASFDIDSYAGEVAYDVWHPVTDETADLRVGIMGGVRYLDVQQTLEVVGVGRQDGEGDWVVLYVGGEFELLVRPASGPLAGRAIGFRAGVATGIDVTGDHGLYAQVRGSLAVEVIRHVNVNIGYRFVSVDFTDGDYGFDGGLRGLFVGGTVRF